MNQPPEHEPDQDIIPPNAPDTYGQPRHDGGGGYQQFQFNRIKLNFPIWLLFLVPVIYMLVWGVMAYAAYVGFAHYAGGLFGFIGVIACMMLGLSPLLLVGAFIAALQVWGWFWLWALLFALPGLVLLAPRLFKAGLSSYRAGFSGFRR